MIDSEFHVSINGVRYRLAEDGEGDHYVRQDIPLRAPNTQITTGKSGEFNLRSDLLLWSWTDWSGGEGQVKFDSTQPNRSELLVNVDPFHSPGQLKLGHFFTIFAGKTSGATDPQLITGHGDALLALQKSISPLGGYALLLAEVVSSNAHLRIWDKASTEWAAPTTYAVGLTSVVGAEDKFVYIIPGTPDLMYVSGVGTIRNNQFGSGGTHFETEVLGDYTYIYSPTKGEIYEINHNVVNTTTAETPIYEGDILKSGTLAASDEPKYGGALVAGQNRIYAMTVFLDRTIIHEITPSSSAATGFGRIYATLDGIYGTGIFWQGGYLYVSTVLGDATDPTHREILYVDPNGSYGTIGAIRDTEGVDVPVGGFRNAHAASFTSAFFAMPGAYSGATAAATQMDLFEIDAITGGIAQTASFASGLVETGMYTASSLVAHDGKVWVSVFIDTEGGDTGTVVAVYLDPQYASVDDGLAISPQINFGLAGEKILQQIEVRCQPVPTSASFEVFYKLDSGSWVSAGSVTAGQSGASFSIDSTPTAKTFRHMQTKVELNSTGVSTTAPNLILDEINVYASTDVSNTQWTLLLDVTDETSPRGYSGATLIENLTDIGDNNPVVLLDGYQDRTFNTYKTADVIVEDLNIALDRPGEGLVQIVLREQL